MSRFITRWVIISNVSDFGVLLTDKEVGAFA